MNRIERVIDNMKKNNIYQFIITDDKAIYYLTNIKIHPGERFLGLYINIDNKVCLINNILFPLTNPKLDVLFYSDTESAIEKMSYFINKNEALGIDKYMPSRFLIEMIERNVAKNYFNGSYLIDYIIMKKDSEEIAKMIKASEINDATMKDIIDFIKPGMKEIEVLEELKSLYIKNGTNEGFSFTPIIGYASNAANPHHNTGDTVIGNSGCLVIDTGCIHNEYCSDMTRTIFLGEPSKEGREIYNIVKTANEMAIEGVKPGVKFSDIDNIARSYIKEKGYGEYFTHRTGHSIGMSVHEYGDVSSIHHKELEEGMIFSIEPGIYYDKANVGVRIEDLILVTKDGYKNLNSFTKELIVK